MIAARLKRTLIAGHRWLGVPLSLFFALWFPSALGMMYWDFPTVTLDNRLARAAPLAPAAIAIAPGAALARVGAERGAVAIQLNTFDGRPVYRVRLGRAEHVVFADTGEVRGESAAASMRRIAARWAADPRVRPARGR